MINYLDYDLQLGDDGDFHLKIAAPNVHLAREFRTRLPVFSADHIVILEHLFLVCDRLQFDLVLHFCSYVKNKFLPYSWPGGNDGGLSGGGCGNFETGGAP